MATYSFDQLIDLLPRGEEFPTSDELPSGVSYGSMIPEFIPPSVALAEGCPEKSQVLIIAAPGAVGKSTLARALSSRRGSLIWDLAEADEVGYGSLDAILENTMQSGLKADFLEWMSEGMQFVIIDALDEGRIKVNENSFLQLLQNISRLARNSKGICFVLLGRTQIAESVWLSLTDNDIEASILTIEPFDRAQANDYIAKHLDREQTRPLVECRDLIFQQLQGPIRDGAAWETTDEFLHYPPVLDAIRVLLEEEINLMSLKNFLKNQATNTSVKLLRNVVDYILFREQQEKFVPRFLESLSKEDNRILQPITESLYTSTEQCQRLLASALSISLEHRSNTLPIDLEGKYNSAVAVALTDHPFLKGVNRFANSIFESYLYARALRGDFGHNLERQVADVLIRSNSLSTMLLAEFYLRTDNDEISLQHQVKPEHVGILYDSLLSSESSRKRVRLTIDGTNPCDTAESANSDAEGEFEVSFIDREDDVGYEPQIINFSLTVSGESNISFRWYVREVQLTVPCTVELGPNVAEFKIGQSVHINARSLFLGSEALVVEKVPPKYSEYEDTGVSLEALEFAAPALGNNLTVYASDFSVSWPGNEAFPWRMFRTNQVNTEFDNDTLHQAYIRFKRIATAFRSRGRGKLARARVKIEHFRMMQGDLGEKLIAQLLNDSILYLGDGGKRYFWNPDVANGLLGVSWMDLRRGKCPQKLRNYLLNFTELYSK